MAIEEQMAAQKRLHEVEAIVQAGRYHYDDEHQLQDQIEQQFMRSRKPYRREFNLAPESVIDFYFPDMVFDFYRPGSAGYVTVGTGLEVKIKGSLGAVTAQLHRYAASPQVSELMLITASAKLANMPEEMLGKPLRVVRLWRGL